MADHSKVTSTCYCGAIHLEYSIEGDNLISSFICHCTDDRKITSSVFASNFALQKSVVKHIRGQENLTKFEQKHGILTGNQIDNFFCKTCGSLMYRYSHGLPDVLILRLGQVDQFELVKSGVLTPWFEQFEKDGMPWVKVGLGEELSHEDWMVLYESNGRVAK